MIWIRQGDMEAISTQKGDNCGQQKDKDNSGKCVSEENRKPEIKSRVLDFSFSVRLSLNSCPMLST